MPKCKYCGVETVKWLRVTNKWVLHNTDGSTHLCQKQQSEGEDFSQKNLPSNEIKPDDESFDPQSDEPTDKMTEQPPSPIMEALEAAPKEIKESLESGHAQSIELYHLLACGMKVFVSGPAGSGKTTAFKLVAPALGHYFKRNDYEFYFKSVCDLTGKHEFEGFMNANGVIVDTDFRKAYTEGHLFLIDEIDAANANVLTVLNATIENGWASFPDGKMPQHPDFRIGVAANTVGLGSDGIYVGRNALDGAFRNRFYFMVWNYDEKLELRLAGKDQLAWVKRVQRIRKAHLSLGKLAPRIVVSPRASIHGATLLRMGFTNDYAVLEDALIWQGCSEDDKSRVLKAARS